MSQIVRSSDERPAYIKTLARSNLADRNCLDLSELNYIRRGQKLMTEFAVAFLLYDEGEYTVIAEERHTDPDIAAKAFMERRNSSTPDQRSSYYPGQ